MNIHSTKKSNNNIKVKEDSKLLNVNDLFNLSEIAFQVELAFSHAYSISKSNEIVMKLTFKQVK